LSASFVLNNTALNGLQSTTAGAILLEQALYVEKYIIGASTLNVK
jgi:hypothetical protein